MRVSRQQRRVQVLSNDDASRAASSLSPSPSSSSSSEKENEGEISALEGGTRWKAPPKASRVRKSRSRSRAPPVHHERAVQKLIQRARAKAAAEAAGEAGDAEERTGGADDAAAESAAISAAMDDPLVRRLAVMIASSMSASSRMPLLKATRCLIDNPEVVRALRAEAEQGVLRAEAEAAGGGSGGSGSGEDFDRRVAGVLSFLASDMKLANDAKLEQRVLTHIRNYPTVGLALLTALFCSHDSQYRVDDSQYRSTL